MSNSGTLNASREGGKNPQSPWSGVLARNCMFSVDTGLGNGYFDTPSLNLGPVRWIADTPRVLFKSRPRPAATGVVEKLEDCTGDRVIEKWSDGARYGGGNSATRAPYWAKRATDGRCMVVIGVEVGAGMSLSLFFGVEGG